MEVIVLSKEEFKKKHKYLKKKAKKVDFKDFVGKCGTIVNYYNSKGEIDLRIITGRV